MLKNNSLYLLLLLLALVSCNKTEENPNKVLWGETEYYTDFLFKKYDPVIMEQTLKFEFNNDAQEFGVNDIELEAVERDENDRFIRTTDVILYKDGEQCPDNILKIKLSDRNIKLGIEFDSKAKEGNHTLYLRVRNTGGLDRIDDVDLSSSKDAILVHEWVVKKDDVYNPLVLLLFWILVVIVALLIIWRIFIRPLMFETFKVKTLIIIYPDSFKTLRIKGCYKVICSKTKQRQSFINKFFTEKIVFVQNDFWEQDVEIVPKDKKSVRVRPPHGFTIMPSSTLMVGADTEITNTNTDQTIKLQIN
jgi:hypothetical protein